MPAFQLVNSATEQLSYQGVLTESIGTNPVEIMESTPAFMRLTGADSRHHLKCTMELALANTPNFLHKHVEGPLEHVLLCTNVMLHKPTTSYFYDEVLDQVLSIKILMQCLEELYLYSAKKLTSGLLFVINEDQISLISAFEELISYAETYKNNNNEKTIFFIPTDLASYDFFLELKEEIHMELHQLLWSNQRSSALVRQYLKTTSLII
jgi:hypothetical protein